MSMISNKYYNAESRIRNEQARIQSITKRLDYIASLKCERCEGMIQFKRLPEWKDLRKRRFCDKCSRIYRNTNRRGRSVTCRGYVYIWVGDRKLMEHVYKAEQVLGRRMKKGEVVHHINGITTDNRNCNLLITTRGEHNLIHRKMARQYRKDHPEFSGPDKIADKLYMKEHFSSAEGV